jgi:hypothetical protein
LEQIEETVIAAHRAVQSTRLLDCPSLLTHVRAFSKRQKVTPYFLPG